MIKPQWIAALVLASVAPSLYAGVGQGDFEAGISASVSKLTIDVDGQETETETGTIAGTFGYFVLDFLELKASVATTVTDDLTFGTFGPGVDFVFLGKKGSVAPFAGLVYGLTFGDELGPVDSDYIDVHGGLKFFFSERAAFEAKLTRLEPVDSDADTGQTQLSAGINVYF